MTSMLVRSAPAVAPEVRRFAFEPCGWCPEKMIRASQWVVSWLTVPYAIGGPHRSMTVCVVCLSDALEYAIGQNLSPTPPSVSRIQPTTGRSAA